MKALIFSSKDIAGTNISNFLIEKKFKVTDEIFEGNPVYEFKDWQLIQTNSELVYAEHLNELDFEKLIFLSRHKSASEKPTLTTHVCGNFGPADLGGIKGKLSTADAILMLNVFKQIKLNNPFEEYAVSLEATHHGPLIEIPHCWVELGSSEKQWKDEKAAEFIADCILNSLNLKQEAPVAIGLGGNHYASVFTKYEGEFAFGHILPKYAQNYLNFDMLKQMIEKTMHALGFILVDKKGISKQSQVRQLAEKTGKEVVVV